MTIFHYTRLTANICTDICNQSCIMHFGTKWSKMGRNGQKWTKIQNFLTKTDFDHFIEYSVIQNIKFIEHSKRTSIMMSCAHSSFNDVFNWLKISKEISSTCKSKLSFIFNDRIFYVSKWTKIDKMGKNGQIQKWPFLINNIDCKRLYRS